MIQLVYEFGAQAQHIGDDAPVDRLIAWWWTWSNLDECVPRTGRPTKTNTQEYENARILTNLWTRNRNRCRIIHEKEKNRNKTMQSKRGRRRWRGKRKKRNMRLNVAKQSKKFVCRWRHLLFMNFLRWTFVMTRSRQTYNGGHCQGKSHSTAQ